MDVTSHFEKNRTMQTSRVNSHLWCWNKKFCKNKTKQKTCRLTKKIRQSTRLFSLLTIQQDNVSTFIGLYSLRKSSAFRGAGWTPCQQSSGEGGVWPLGRTLNMQPVCWRDTQKDWQHFVLVLIASAKLHLPVQLMCTLLHCGWKTEHNEWRDEWGGGWMDEPWTLVWLVQTRH